MWAWVHAIFWSDSIINNFKIIVLTPFSLIILIIGLIIKFDDGSNKRWDPVREERFSVVFLNEPKIEIS